MAWLILIAIATPMVFALVMLFWPAERAKWVALWGTLISGVAIVAVLGRFDWDNAAAMQGQAGVTWIESLGLRLSIGVDGVALLLMALTALLGPVCVLASWTAVRDRVKLYYGWLLVLQAAMLGVFAARDLMLFYICFEFTLLPMFLLIRVYGSTNRERASVKFFLYTFTGSLIALAGLVYLVWWVSDRSGSWTLDIATLTEHAVHMPVHAQALVLGALLAGFAVKVPLFPVHTWLPLAHTEAPTAGSVILAGVLLKLGTYGIYRFALPMAPAAVVEYAPAIATLAIIGILYAGLICWVQDDVKKLVAYSSVSHLGFCVLGMVALNTNGLTGGVLYMLSHGFSTGALFLMIGFMYERYHTRDMRQVGGLASKMPIWATFMVFFALASVGLPGLNGFPSELLCLIGAFQSDASWSGVQPGAQGVTLGPWFAAVAGAGMVIAAMYLLYMVGKMCFGSLREPAAHGHHDDEGHHLPTDLGVREIITLLPLAAACLYFGLYPKSLIDGIEAPVNQTVAWVEGHSSAGEGAHDAMAVGERAPGGDHD
ncbi:MAG: NADH-quinone oxidoreductase subunit M [Phycisphaerales bacterium]